MYNILWQFASFYVRRVQSILWTEWDGARKQESKREASSSKAAKAAAANFIVTFMRWIVAHLNVCINTFSPAIQRIYVSNAY